MFAAANAGAETANRASSAVGESLMGLASSVCFRTRSRAYKITSARLIGQTATAHACSVLAEARSSRSAFSGGFKLKVTAAIGVVNHTNRERGTTKVTATATENTQYLCGFMVFRREGNHRIAILRASPNIFRPSA